MLIERAAQVLAPAIGSQDLDSGAVLLSECPSFERLVGLKTLVFGLNQEADGIASGVVRDSVKVTK
jgi:hypothetical protein